MALPTTNCSLSDIADEYSNTILFSKPHSFSEYSNQGSFQTLINNPPVHDGIRKLRTINGSRFSVLFFEQNSTWQVPLHVTEISCVLIGGGGGGGIYGTTASTSTIQQTGPGGGGGGGVLESTIAVTPGTQYNFTIGQGGAVGPYRYRWSEPGGDTIAFGLTAYGGGGGGNVESMAKSSNGSGGGGSASKTWNFAGSYNDNIYSPGSGGSQGYGGGTAGSSSINYKGGGGGGGAGGKGGDMTTYYSFPVAGVGGPGKAINIAGPDDIVTYAGGGGGYAYPYGTAAGGAGSENAGGGGSVGSAGKNGLIIVRYLLPA